MIHILRDLLLITQTFVSLAHQICDQIPAPQRDYKVAVIEYQPVEFHTNISAPEYILKNVAKLQEFAENCVDCDILVFPEYGLTSTSVLNVPNLNDYAQEIPKKIKVCHGNRSFWSVLEHISCIG